MHLLYLTFYLGMNLQQNEKISFCRSKEYLKPTKFKDILFNTESNYFESLSMSFLFCARFYSDYALMQTPIYRLSSKMVRL